MVFQSIATPDTVVVRTAGQYPRYRQTDPAAGLRPSKLLSENAFGFFDHTTTRIIGVWLGFIDITRGGAHERLGDALAFAGFVIGGTTLICLAIGSIGLTIGLLHHVFRFGPQRRIYDTDITLLGAGLVIPCLPVVYLVLSR